MLLVVMLGLMWSAAGPVHVVSAPFDDVPARGATASTLSAAVPTASAPDTPRATSQAFTVLVLGSDARAGQSQLIRTDSVLLVRIDPDQQRLAAVALPRDLWVTYPDGEEGRLNAAYSVGEQRAVGSGGTFVKQTVSAAVGVPVDYVALVTFAAFADLVDRVGGISITVPQALDDPRYPTDDYDTIHVQFAAGPQHLDGVRALQYVRIRNPDGDFDRLQRQRQVVAALLERLRSAGQLQQLVGLADVVNTLGTNVTTDLPQDLLLDSASWAASLTAAQIDLLAVEPTMVTPMPPPATLQLTDDAQQQVIKHLAGRS
ncbi:LCP family protein [Candidatus Gracilibacteria bacterium]|nr:LCP family protein [Candidatus Gracilibacteria bacterium]